MQTQVIQKQGTMVEPSFTHWLEAFLRAKKSERRSPKTIEWYAGNLGKFLLYANAQLLTLGELTPSNLRDYLLWLEQEGHNSGGIHGHYRALRSFLRWIAFENDLDKSPIDKVKGPRVSQAPLEPIPVADVQAMMDVCKRSSFLGCRDAALLLFLLDTGLRANELLSLRREDLDPLTGAVAVKRGKGGKPRTTYIGRITRRHMRKYLKLSRGVNLWTTRSGEGLTYSGLVMMLRRRANDAGIQVWLPHSFRRAFALNYLRNGGDIMTLRELLGHRDLQVLERYVKLVGTDLQAGHAASSPVDGMHNR